MVLNSYKICHIIDYCILVSKECQYFPSCLKRINSIELTNNSTIDKVKENEKKGCLFSAGWKSNMKNPKIAEALRYYRKLKGYSVHDVAGILAEHKNAVAVKTVYGWENGTTQPDADTLMFLCELYGITDVLYTFGYNSQCSKQTSSPLTQKEIKLIEGYRNNPDMQGAVDRLLNL